MAAERRGSGNVKRVLRSRLSTTVRVVSRRPTRVSRERAMRARRTVLPRIESARVVSRLISRLSRVAERSRWAWSAASWAR